ncbi:RAP domain-containing protein, partial [Endozoicomonas sp. ALC013]|uniref:RAP domain-containing protein n=1 Tax=Endozoicomonas sp. ALC013 TaxID=3403076 RepID=UPI003BB63055
RHEFYRASDACSANHPPRHSIKPVQDFNALITQERMDELMRISTHYGDRYNGKKHSQFATLIKQYTLASQRSLNHSEQRQLIPLLHNFKATPLWGWRSLTTTFHSFTSAGVFTPHTYMDACVKETQAVLLSNLLDLVILKCNQKPETRDIDAQGTANLLWALAKLVGNGLELEKTPRIKEAVAALLPRVKTKAESKEEKDHFIPQHISNLLWALAKLVDNGLELEKTPKLKEALAALLPHVKTKAESKAEKDHFNIQATTNLLWTLAKLVDNGLELEKTAQLKEAVAALLRHVKTKAESKEEKDHFDTQATANLLWAMAKLLDNGLELEKAPKLKEAVAALLPDVKTKAESKEEKDHFIPQHIANLLWAFAKLVDNGLKLEKTAKLKEAVAALLPHVKTRAESKEAKDHFIPQHIANLLWALAKLVENGLEIEKTPQLKVAVAALLPRVKTKAESKEERDHFNPQEVANLMWAVAKLVDNRLDLGKTPKLKETVAALLSYVKTRAESKQQKVHFIPQHITSLLWAVAKLVDNGLEMTAKLKEVVAALLPHVKTKAESKEEKDHFNTQGITNLLWAVAKLVDNGLALEKAPKLTEAVAALLPHVKTKAESKEEKDHFIPQHIANLLWALAKLVDNGLELELEKTAILTEALAALLYHVKTKAKSKEEKDHFIPQHIANLLWAVAKLVDNGLELETTAILKETLAALLYHVKTKAKSKEEKDHFIPQHIANLLWAVAKLGEAIELNLVKSTFDSLVERISENPQFPQQGILMSLWGVMVFCARFYLCNGTNNKSSLEKHIGALFSRLENTFPIDTEYESIIAMGASWLGRACLVVPHYPTVISQSQSTFRDQLQSSLPSLKIEEEKSLNSLPPIDLLLPDYNMVIDVQGPSHYVNGDFKTRNGSTLLKIVLLQKLGFEVIEIPVNKLWKQDSMTRVIEQIKTKLAVSPEAHGPVSPDSSREWAAGEEYFTADEGGQFSDDCYFTAEEYLEEQINKPKKRKRKRKKASKTNAC